MRIAVASHWGLGVGLWRRLIDEGNDLLVWIGDDKGGPLVANRKVGTGLVPRTDSWGHLLAWAKEGARAHEPTLMLFETSGLGKYADEARAAGLFVVGGGAFADKLEQQRMFGMQISVEAGCSAPPYVEFATIDQTIAFAQSGNLDRPVYWKTDTYIDSDATHGADTPDELVEYLTFVRARARPQMKNVLQEKIDGVALSTARWWNGRAWVGPYDGTIERKKLLAGDVGPSTGASLTGMWFYGAEEPAIARALCWERTAEAFRKNEAPPGLYDVNAVVAGGEAYFLEWTPRFGWDSEPTIFLLYRDLGKWLWWIASGQGDGGGWIENEIALSIRLAVAPYPWEHGERDEKGSCVGVPVRGSTGNLYSEGFVAYELMQDAIGLALAAPEGIVGLSAAAGDSLEALAEDVTDFARKKLRVPGLMFRVDSGDAVREDADKIADEGFGDDLPESLFM